MQYFTGKFQGRIPILSADPADAWGFERGVPDNDATQIIATLLTAIYGGSDWAIEPNTDYSMDIILRP